MQKEIRQLGTYDIKHIQQMQTNVVDDYIPHAFYNLIEYPNILYGLFVDGMLASVAGYTVFARKLAMLGRLRSDVRFHGYGFATELMAFVRDQAFKHQQIRWVGANTQRDNKPTHRVLEKIGFKHHMTSMGATATTVATLESGDNIWQEITCLKRKQDWLGKLYIEEKSYFPYECYYLLPAIQSLFTEETLKKWLFYENDDQTRVIIMKQDEKKHTYLHVIYPWDDLAEQKGIWETITKAKKQLEKPSNSEVHIWIDLSEKAVNTLPNNHPFDLPSPWTLYGVYREI